MPTRALVLGGGGPVGIAWETGLAAGLAQAGLELRDADFIVGTSAGSFVGAQLASGRDPQSLVAAQLARAGGSRPAPENSAPAADLTPLMQHMMKLYTSHDPEQARRDVGAFSLQAKTIDEEAFIRTFGHMNDAWPAKRYACTAVDTATGAFQVWDNDSNVTLPRAVASSCSVPGIYPPITINGKRYMDGGMRSGTNADLAKGYERVIVVIVRGRPVAGAEAMAELAEKRLEGEFAAIRESGGQVETIVPDEATVAAMGANLMNFAVRGPVVEAGVAQGKREAARLSAFWKA